MKGFHPPGPGSWVLDTTHFTSPVTRFTRELFADPVARGFRDGTRPYGLLLDHIAWGFVHHWPYLSPRPVAELRTTDELDRDGWDRLVADSPGLRDRLAASAAVFAVKAWRADLEWWDHEVKPSTIRAHEALARVDPGGLDRPGMAAYLDRCRENLRGALYRHHRLNVAAVIAVGDLLVHTDRWTGRSAADVLGLLGRSTPLFLGAGDELAAAAAALEREADAAALLRGGGDPGAVLASLLSWAGATGPAVSAYVQRVADRPVGSGADIGDPRLAELPGVMLRTLEGAMRSRPSDPGDAAAEQAAELRRRVPPGRREEFDQLLDEARATYRLRDERATFCDVWAFGLMRRAVLGVGAHLAGTGAVEEPVHLVEAGYGEMRSLLEGHPLPRALPETLAERARERAGARLDEAPPFLGPLPRPPIPPEWLPDGAARTERAFRAYVEAMSAEAAQDEAPEGGRALIRGTGASPGRYEGTARLVYGADELSRIEEGDVLVAGATSPAFNVVLPLLGAIVTDSGGLLSHAAIVARDYGIPAVVGTVDATARIADGARIRVDGNLGEVTTTE